MTASIAEYGRIAQERFPQFVNTSTALFLRDDDPVSLTVRNNIAAFAAVGLRPRVMRDITQIGLATTVLGSPISLPVMIGPAGGHARFTPEGELATARAAGAAGTLFGVSTISTRSIEDIARVASGPLWFQLYMLKNHAIAERLVRRAEAAGYTAILVSVDKSGTLSTERNNINTRIRYPDLHANFAEEDFPGIPAADLPTRVTYPQAKRAFVWRDIAWLRSVTRLPIVIKGIQTAEDAWLCAKHGVDGLVVSNHGGQGLQGATGTLRTLPEVVTAVGSQLEVYLDGGVRSGSDVLKALALGARAILLGRAYVWALIVEGEAGVRGAIEIVRTELIDAMGNCGVTDVSRVPRSLVSYPATFPARIGAPVEPSSLRAALAAMLEHGDITAAEHASLGQRVEESG